jgi:hypothetical protein
MKIAVLWDVSVKSIAPIFSGKRFGDLESLAATSNGSTLVFLRSVLQLLVTAKAVPSSLNLSI